MACDQGQVFNSVRLVLPKVTEDLRDKMNISVVISYFITLKTELNRKYAKICPFYIFLFFFPLRLQNKMRISAHQDFQVALRIKTQPAHAGPISKLTFSSVLKPMPFLPLGTATVTHTSTSTLLYLLSSPGLPVVLLSPLHLCSCLLSHRALHLLSSPQRQLCFCTQLGHH